MPPKVELDRPIPSDSPRELAKPPAPSNVEPPSAKPKPADDRQPTPVLPAGIPQFTAAKDRVSSGLRPSVDGWKWLQSKGYQAVLYVHSPDRDDSSDHKQAEQHGMKYLPLKVTPQSLTQDDVDAFIRLVDAEANRPLFVYDNDGSLAGGLWYLYFRMADRLSHEDASRKAAQLGLKQIENKGEGHPAHMEMWNAIQKLLDRARL